MLTPKQAAEKIGVSASMVYQWCKDGLIEHFRFGCKGKRGKVLIDTDVLQRFIEDCRHSPQPTGLRHIRMKAR